MTTIEIIIIAIGLSMDISIGISMAMLKVNIMYASLTICIVTIFMCLISMSLGTKLGALFGKRMVIVGGFILIAIGIRILI